MFTFDNPPVNALSQPVRASLLAAVEALDADPAVRAIVLAGAGRAFVAGADVREFDRPPAEPLLPAVLSRLEACAKPVVAALHGATLGGGAETALACHYRCASGDLQLGFPGSEPRPPAGRRRHGPAAAPRRLAGVARPHDRRASRSASILRSNSASSTGGSTATSWPARWPGRASSRAPALPTRRVLDLPVPPSRPAQFEEYLRALPASARRLPAPPRIVEALASAALLPADAALARARALFLECLDSVESRALRHLFFAERRPAPDPGLARAVGQAAVLGAGTMGSGIAISLATGGIAVTLVDAKQEALDAGLARVKSAIDASERKGRLDAAAAAAARGARAGLADPRRASPARIS